MAEKAPAGSAYLGPMDPTGNKWFPENLMGIGIPVKLAVAMCEDLDGSFIIRRPHVAYPEVREDLCSCLEQSNRLVVKIYAGFVSSESIIAKCYIHKWSMSPRTPA
jgi:hypothetical protein